MKKVFNTSGLDTTAATQAYLLSTPTEKLFVKDCYFIGPPRNYPYQGQSTPAAGANYGAYPIVDGDYPISYQGVTYQPFSVEKDKLEYKIGFDAAKLDLTLRPREYPQLVGGGSIYTRGTGASFSEGLAVNAPYYDPYLTKGTDGPSTLQAFQTMRQGLASGDFFFAPVTMTRMIMATPGDTSTYGGVVMFRGRVNEITCDRFEIKMTVMSLMEIFTQKVPTQLIEPGNRWLAWNFNSSPNGSGNGTGAGGFNWFTTDQSYTTNQWAEAWATVTVVGYGTWVRRVWSNTNSTLWLYEPVPISLGTAGLTITFKIWAAGSTATTAGQPGQGFPAVPKPEVGLL